MDTSYHSVKLMEVYFVSHFKAHGIEDSGVVRFAIFYFTTDCLLDHVHEVFSRFSRAMLIL